MPLFECTCGNIENTALTMGSWGNLHEKKPMLCSRCYHGRWHGRFPEKKATDKDRYSGRLQWVMQNDKQLFMTCSYCRERETCDLAFDPYNTEGSCLVKK
jgi:hypothetical protein